MTKEEEKNENKLFWKDLWIITKRAGLVLILSIIGLLIWAGIEVLKGNL